MEKFNLTVVSPEGRIYEGESERVRVPGKIGGMTILARHAPLLGALAKGKVSLINGPQKTEFDIERGFVEVDEKGVNLFVRPAE